MQKYLFLIMMISSFQVMAQLREPSVDFRFGTGISLLGSGDMITINFENEVNYKFNRIFTGSASINYGHSNTGVHEASSFLQGNLNLFLSPFGNKFENVFRLGGGLSYYNVSDVYQKSTNYFGPETAVNYHRHETRSSLGYNIILENSYYLSRRFLVGIKVFAQPYINGDINSGVILKGGLEL